MQRLLSIALSCLFAVSLSAQEPSITYPYNPDSNTDSLIGASDLVDFLPFYGEEFTPEPLTIEGMSVEEWMEQQNSSSGGGCDFKFPEGFHGVPITEQISSLIPFTVPEGKRLYVLLLEGTNFKINDNLIHSTIHDGEVVMLNSGDDLNSSGSNVEYFNGLLVDERNDLYAVTSPISSLISYTVPEGKTLYIQLLESTNFRINDNLIPSTIHGGEIVILKSGDVLNGSGSNIEYFNGYIVDEDYFANCGGGGGVDISGLQEQIDAVAADSYAADAALLTASDNADDELQAQIDANAVADQIESQAGTETDALLLTEINQNKSEVETEINLLQSGLSDNYTSDVQESIAGDLADAELQAQIDEAVSNLQEQLDSALASNENLQEQLDSIAYNINVGNNLENGTNIGDMLFWNGADWATIHNGLEGSQLVMGSDGPIWSTPSLTVGSSYLGGTIGYIYSNGDAGYIEGEVHGYIYRDDNVTMSWGCNGQIIGTNSGIGQGISNTQNISANCNSPNSAAFYCNNLIINGYDDWFLPTFSEAKKAYEYLYSTVYNGNQHYALTSEEAQVGQCSYCDPSSYIITIYTLFANDWSSKTGDYRVYPVREF